MPAAFVHFKFTQTGIKTKYYNITKEEVSKNNYKLWFLQCLVSWELSLPKEIMANGSNSFHLSQMNKNTINSAVHYV